MMAESLEETSKSSLGLLLSHKDKNVPSMSVNQVAGSYQTMSRLAS